ncbi:MAG: hypothetical protein LIP02_07060 [Bacteroidales bacterium]|nr:hypothetical protein [Bacteroidales bacterium]
MLSRRFLAGALVALAAAVCVPTAAAKPDVQSMAYEIVSDGQSEQGWCMVKVTVVTDSKKDAQEMATVEAAAVHGVLFKGFAGTSVQGSTGEPALLSPTVEAEHADYFKAFFKNDDWRSYVSAVSPSVTVAKRGKKWAGTATVKVNKKALRKTLEGAGIMRSLGI